MRNTTCPLPQQSCSLSLSHTSLDALYGLEIVLFLNSQALWDFYQVCCGMSAPGRLSGLKISSLKPRNISSTFLICILPCYFQRKSHELCEQCMVLLLVLFGRPESRKVEEQVLLLSIQNELHSVTI